MTRLTNLKFKPRAAHEKSPLHRESAPIIESSQLINAIIDGEGISIRDLGKGRRQISFNLLKWRPVDCATAQGPTRARIVRHYQIQRQWLKLLNERHLKTSQMLVSIHPGGIDVVCLGSPVIDRTLLAAAVELDEAAL